MKILTIVLARKNSKRLKNKHHLDLGGKSLIEHTFDLLKKTKLFCNIIISTDDEKILKKVKQNYKSFIPLKRSKNLSMDSTESYKVLIDIYKWYEKNYSIVDGIFLLQPTSPFRKLSTIKKMMNIFKKNKMQRSIISVKKIKDHPEWMFEIRDEKLIRVEKQKPIRMSQYLRKLYIVNGLGYLLVPRDLLIYKSTIPANSQPFICNSEIESLDIDTIEDLNKARAIKNYFNIFK